MTIARRTKPYDPAHGGDNKPRRDHRQPESGYDIDLTADMSGSERSLDIDLSNLGVVKVGQIDSKLLGKVKAQLEPPQVAKVHSRQTELFWNEDCKAIVEDFESRLKPDIAALRNKTCQNYRFIFFHEHPHTSPIYSPKGAGKYIVAITIRPGPGLRHYEGSHKAQESSNIVGPPKEFSLDEGSVIVFAGNIARVDPAITSPSAGAAEIILLYADS